VLTSVVLQFRSGTSLLSEVGVDPAFNVFASTDFTAETDVALNTGIALANPNSTTGYVLARMWDPATGQASLSTIITLPPNGHVAKFLTDIFSSALNIAQTRVEVSLDSCTTSSCAVAGGNGFLATAIRLNIDQFTTIPLRDDSDPSLVLPTRVLPQVAFGGPSSALNMKTVLYFTTNVTTGTFGTADIFDNDGNPLQASVDGGAPVSSFTFTVLGSRVTRMVLSGDQTLRSGWIRLTLPGSVHLITDAVFQTFNGSTLASEAGVLESVPANTGSVYVKTHAGSSNTGLAIANSNTSSNTIHLTLFTHDGFVLAARDVTLGPNGHLAQFVTDLFPQIASATDFDGGLSMSSPLAFSPMALRLSFDKLATLPVSANGMYRPTIGAIRVTNTVRLPATVNFEADFTDYDGDVATASTTAVAARTYVDFGSTIGYDFADITIDGTAVLNRSTGTLKGSFQLPHVTSTVPSGTQAVFYIWIKDSGGNQSNFVAVPFRF
jgi:hypothetical protein